MILRSSRDHGEKGTRMVTQFAFQVQLDGAKKGLEMKEREVSGKRGDFECNGLDGREGTPEFPEESGAPVPWASTIAKAPSSPEYDAEGNPFTSCRLDPPEDK